MAYTYNLGPQDVRTDYFQFRYVKTASDTGGRGYENGARVHVITNNASSPLALTSDYRIITATREKLLTGEFWFSQDSCHDW